MRAETIANAIYAIKGAGLKLPKIVTLCGSTRFTAAYQKANFDETIAGNIVLTIGCDMKADSELFGDKTPDELAQIKEQLDRLHLQKILISDEILVLNVDGYIGSSTMNEIHFAFENGKTIRYLEPGRVVGFPGDGFESPRTEDDQT